MSVTHFSFCSFWIEHILTWYSSWTFAHRPNGMWTEYAQNEILEMYMFVAIKMFIVLKGFVQFHLNVLNSLNNGMHVCLFFVHSLLFIHSKREREWVITVSVSLVLGFWVTFSLARSHFSFSNMTWHLIFCYNSFTTNLSLFSSFLASAYYDVWVLCIVFPSLIGSLDLLCQC